jgi:hypothetical protein
LDSDPDFDFGGDFDFDFDGDFNGIKFRQTGALKTPSWRRQGTPMSGAGVVGRGTSICSLVDLPGHRFDFVDAAPVAFAALGVTVERSFEKEPNQFAIRFGILLAAAQGEAIRIVVPACHLGGVLVGADGAPHALHFCGSERNADAGAAHEHHAVRLAAFESGHGAAGAIGVIDGGFVPGAEVDDSVSEAADFIQNGFAHVDGGVVISECDFHFRLS